VQRLLTPFFLTIALIVAGTVTAAYDGRPYLPRQDGGANGRVARYSVSASDDGEQWREITSGTLADDAVEKQVDLPATTTRWLRFEVLGATNGQPFASAGELSFWQAAR
jgi:F5/8 type C domain